LIDPRKLSGRAVNVSEPPGWDAGSEFWQYETTV